MKVGITGTIGSGKTMVSDYLRSKDIDVFDCDAYNAELLKNNKEVLNKILQVFPECVDHLVINKTKLAEIVFNDDNKRLKLESIMHPYIFDKMNEISKSTDLFVAEVPLLFETNLDSYFDVTILVVTNSNIAHERLLDKGYSLEQVKNRELKQLPVENKMKRATEIIYNNGSFVDLYKEIDKLLLKYDWQ